MLEDHRTAALDVQLGLAKLREATAIWLEPRWLPDPDEWSISPEAVAMICDDELKAYVARLIVSVELRFGSHRGMSPMGLLETVLDHSESPG